MIYSFLKMIRMQMCRKKRQAPEAAAVDDMPIVNDHNYSERRRFSNRNEAQPPATTYAARLPAPTAEMDEPPTLSPVHTSYAYVEPMPSTSAHEKPMPSTSAHVEPTATLPSTVSITV